VLALAEETLWQPNTDDNLAFIGSPEWDNCMSRLMDNKQFVLLLMDLPDEAIAQVKLQYHLARLLLSAHDVVFYQLQGILV